MTKKRFLFLVVLVVLGLTLAACDRTKISDITADPGSFRDKEVVVAGTVTQSIGILGKGVYQIDDGTGKLWVWSDTRGVPSRGANVGVKGKIMPTVTFLGINYATVMREIDRHAESRSSD